MDSSNTRKRRHSASLWLHGPKKSRQSSDSSVLLSETINSNEVPPVSVSTPKSQRIQDTSITPRKVIRPKRKRLPPTKLFADSGDATYNTLFHELSNLLPTVAKKLYDAKLLVDFLTFFRLVATARFPLQNICLLLFLEVARWFGCENGSNMSYSESTLKFWKVGYRIFHGKFIRFMSGLKLTGELLTNQSEPGTFKPERSSINFIVPSVKIISAYQDSTLNLPSELRPGIIHQSIDIASKNTHVSHVLCVDGKKVASGLSSSGGDVDLFGHEDTVSLGTLKSRLDEELLFTKSISSEVHALPTSHLSEILEPTKQPLVQKLRKLVGILSGRVKDARELKLKQDHALEKFRKLGGQDWRTSRYCFAISGIQTSLFQIQLFVKQALGVIGSLCHYGSNIVSSSSFVEENVVDSSFQDNLVRLKSVMPEALVGDSRYVKQRSPEWFELRKQAPVTGSTMHTALGLRTLKEQKTHFDTAIHNKAPAEHPPDVQERMDHGSRNEGNAVATLVGTVLPFFYPGTLFVEEGAHFINSSSSDTKLCEVSPDGSLRSSRDGVVEHNSLMAVEIKCPFPSSFKTPVAYSMPPYYVLQCLAEMVALGVDKLVFASYSAESTTIFEAHRDDELWNTSMEEVERVYGCEKPRRPTTVPQHVKDLKPRLQDYVKNKVKFVAEVPSKTESDSQLAATPSEHSPHMVAWSSRHCAVKNTTDLMKTLLETEKLLSDGYQLTRKKASEVLVFLLSDMDRLWKPEMPHSLPVAWGMKGYSLTCAAMRRMLDSLLAELHAKEVHIACTTFDGQWYNIAVRSSANKPLTLHQLQRDVWQETQKLSKADLLSKIKVINQIDTSDEDAQRQVAMCKTSDRGLLVSGGACRITTPLDMSLWRTLECVPDRGTLEMPETVDIFDQLPTQVLEVIERDSDILDAITDVLQDESRTIESGGHDTESRQIENIANDQAGPIEDGAHDTESRPFENEAVNRLTNVDYVQLLELFQVHEKFGPKWCACLPDAFRDKFRSAESMLSFTNEELGVIVDATYFEQQQVGSICRKSWTKTRKVNILSRLFGDGSTVTPAPLRRKKVVPSLKQMAIDTLSSKRYPKMVLNVAYATYLFPTRLKEWQADGTITSGMEIEGLRPIDYWYSYPEYNTTRGQLEPKCLDGEHLFANMRVNICKNGAGVIKKDAWHKVAETDPKVVSKAVVVDLIDRQSNGFARKTFSPEVEAAMMKNGDCREAAFVRLIREWYDAEDLPGLSAADRGMRRIALRDYLLEGVNFGCFPPPGSHIKGFPRVQFEGLLQSIDTHLQLYAICKGGTYNQRAVSSLEAETFFSVLTEMEPTKLGCPKATNVGRLMSTVTELMHYRADPTNRVFQMRTARNPVYPSTQLEITPDSTGATSDGAIAVNSLPVSRISSIILRDHFFDETARRRTKGRTKTGEVNSPNKPSRGDVGVRQYHKRNEGKIIPSVRAGIDHLL